MVEKGTRGGIRHTIHRYVKANIKYKKNNDKKLEASCLKYWDVNNLYRWTMSQKFPLNSFKRVENTSQFDKDFMKSYNEDSDEGFFF